MQSQFWGRCRRLACLVWIKEGTGVAMEEGTIDDDAVVDFTLIFGN